MKTYMICFLTLMICSCAVAEKTHFQADWESLKKTAKMPEWLQDAKFGYYFHWGPQTYSNEDVPFNPGFYPGTMYDPQRPTFEYHQKTFGNQAQFGWKDIVGQWEVDGFDADQWVDLFVKGGARFGGCLAMHVDNIALWDSEVTSWNLKKYGPRVDVLGELQKAYRSHNMPMVATFHHGVNWTLAFVNAHQYDAADGKNLDLYNEPHKKTDPPTERFLKKWQALVQEVVEKYSPEGLYFDYGLKTVIPDPYRREVMAHFYNHCVDKEIEGVFVHKHRDIIPGGILDTERGRPPHLWDEPFMNDKSIARRCWFNKKTVIESEGLYTSGELLCALVDLVSKKGVMMLSVAPDKHGRIPEDQKQLMMEIGNWLKRNGEGIYKTRSWEIIGEGPFLAAHSGWHRPQLDSEYSSEDVRYTRSKDGSKLYAALMARPDAGLFSLSRVRFKQTSKPSVRLLGYGSVKFDLDKEGLITFNIPELDEDKFVQNHPVVLVLEGMNYHAVSEAPAETAPENEKTIAYAEKGKILEVQLLKKPEGAELVLKDYFLTPSENAKITWGKRTVQYELNDKGQAVIAIKQLGKWDKNKLKVLRLSGFKFESHYDRQ